MSAPRFKRALKVLEKWPLDPTKSKPRDIGALLRTRIETEFRHGEESEIRDPDVCDRMLNSLENLCNNKYQKLYESKLVYGSLGFNREISYYSTSDVMLSALRTERNPSVIKRFLGKFSRKQQYDKLLEAPKTEIEKKPDNS